MKVLHIYRTYFPETQGGIEEVIRQISGGSRSLGVESRVLSLSQAPCVHDMPEATVFQAKRSFEIASCGFSFDAPGKIKKLSEWADIVHYHFPWPFLDVLDCWVPPSKPRILTYHSDIIRQRLLRWLYFPIMHHYLGKVDRIVATSPNYLESSEILSRYREKVRVVPIGLDEERYSSDFASETPANVRLNDTKPFFLFVGVLRYYKGLHVLLHAIKGAPYQVVIVGSGPVEKELQAIKARLQLDNVILAGYLDDHEKNWLLARCRAVVFPSFLRSEAFGVTLLEGAIKGKPLISAEIGSGTSHVNVDGETGIVVPPGDPVALRLAMDRLARDELLAHALGRRARGRYEALFTASAMARAYHSIYSEILGLKGNTADKLSLPTRTVSVNDRN